jgi:hypothetical protein
MLVGEAGPELVSVTLMQRGTGRGALGQMMGSGSDKDIGDLLQEMKDLTQLVKTLMVVSRTENYTEAHLLVDGYRLSRVSTKYMGNYANGDY